MMKVFFQRGPDRMFHQFHVTGPEDQWVPLPGQDVQIQSALHGAGWYLVVSVRPVYHGSQSHSQIAKELQHDVTMVYARHIEVYLESKRIKPCSACGTTAMLDARYCYHCGERLPELGTEFTQPPLAQRTKR